ncbi:MAG: hypothetical protein ACP5HH_07945 [Fervidicoccaceae archaeon]
MEERGFIMKIPPFEFQTARRLSLYFASFMASYAPSGVNIAGDSLVFSGSPDLVLNGAFSSIIDMYKSKLLATNSERLPCPRIKVNINDYKWVAQRLSSKLGFSISDDDTICSFFKKVVDSMPVYISRIGNIALETELKSINLSGDTLYLGGDMADFAQLQVLKLEKYEYGRNYLSLKFKGDMKISPLWYGILGGGWLASFSGYFGDTLLSLLIDENLILSEIQNIGSASVITSVIEDFSEAPIKVKEPPSHGEAYTLLLFLNMSPQILGRAGVISLSYQRITVGNNAYIVTEEIPISLSSLYQMLQPLITGVEYGTLKKSIEDLLKCTLRSAAGRSSAICQEKWGDLSTMSAMVRSLWNILSGIDPYGNVYRLSRLSGDAEYTFRDPRVLRQLMKLIKRA